MEVVRHAAPEVRSLLLLPGSRRQDCLQGVSCFTVRSPRRQYSMITLMMAMLAQCGAVELQSPCCNNGRNAKPWRGSEKIAWEKSLDRAKARAAVEGKPILLFQLVGDLDREGC